MTRDEDTWQCQVSSLLADHTVASGLHGNLVFWSCFASKCSFRGRYSPLDMVVIVEEPRFRDRCSES